MLTLNVMKPSVNNMTVRVFLRAAGLEFTEEDVYGKTREPAFLDKCPAHMTPLLEVEGLPKDVLWESCAIMQYLCNRDGLTQFYPSEPAARAMNDSAMFYIIGTLYPRGSRITTLYKRFQRRRYPLPRPGAKRRQPCSLRLAIRSRCAP